MKRNSNKLITIILTTVFLFSFSGVGFAKSVANISNKLDYVAIGDSLADGMAPNGTIGDSYTTLLKDKFEQKGVLQSYNDGFAVSGLATQDIVNRIALDMPVKLTTDAAINAAINAKIDAALSNIKMGGKEIITLDIGANDLINLLRNGNTPTPTDIQTVATNIVKIITYLKTYNPNAKLYVMAYYDASDEIVNYMAENKPGGLTPEQKSDLKTKIVLPAILGLNQAIKGATTATGTTYVDTFNSFENHLAKYLPVADNIHPDMSGYRAIYKDFYQIIKQDFLTNLK